MVCPKCSSKNIESQVFQENTGGTTVTKSQYKEKGHGCLWWCVIGWWWWMIDMFIWLFAFLPRILIHIGRKKKYKGKSVSTTKNDISYRTVNHCKDCGHNW